MYFMAVWGIVKTTDNPLNTDTRYNDTIRYNDNLTVTKSTLKRKYSVTNYARILYLVLTKKNIYFGYLLESPQAILTNIQNICSMRGNKNKPRPFLHINLLI